jgi:RNA polymerase sigma factor (TIGR02999 family)
MAEITELLREWADGDREAFDKVLPMVYEELRVIARGQLRRRGRALDTTALVHELYLKIADQEPELADRSHLMALSACAMRQVIVSHARKQLAEKRGGGVAPVSYEEMHASVDSQAEWMLDLDRALARLRTEDERLAQTFECRYFAGLTEEETAEALGVSLRTSQRDWNRARAWIRSALEVDSH